MLLRTLSVVLALTTATFGVLLLCAQNHQASQSDATAAHSQLSAIPLILEENDGEHRLRRPGGPTGSGSVPEFIIKIDKQNGNAEDFYVGTETLNPGAMIPFHKHHNSEEVVIFEEGGATVTVGDKRAVAGPRSIVFIPRETWVSITNTGNNPIHGYYIFSRQGFENFLRARSVRPGEPLTPLTPEEVRRAAEDGHVTPWDTSKGPYPPGVPHP
jgi:mannose-6-phosphate isomerase-like protein (cupin superfamily)